MGLVPTGITHVRYVRHHEVAAYLKAGWIVAFSLGPTHGEWSIGMAWLCECQLGEAVGEAG